MRILFLTPVIPSPSYGRRPYNFIKYLRREHEVTVLALDDYSQPGKAAGELAEWGVRLQVIPHSRLDALRCTVLGVLRGLPIRCAWCTRGDLRRALVQLLAQEHFDLLHIDRARLAHYARYAAPLPVVVDFTDALTLYLERGRALRRRLDQRLVDGWELWRLPGFERRVAPFFRTALVCSEMDAAEVRKTVPAEKVRVIHNGVDTAEFAPHRRADGGAPRLIFTGTLTYFPNVDSLRWLAEDIFPLLGHSGARHLEGARQPVQDDQVPGTFGVEVIGAQPTAEVGEICRRSGFHLVGEVARMCEHLYQEDVFVCPLRLGAGMRNKLLEAMAAGMAVVSTRLGAENLGVRDGEELLLADTPRDFAAAVERLLAEPELRRRLGEQGRRYVEQHHSEAALGRELEKVYREMLR